MPFVVFQRPVKYADGCFDGIKYSVDRGAIPDESRTLIPVRGHHISSCLYGGTNVTESTHLVTPIISWRPHPCASFDGIKLWWGAHLDNAPSPLIIDAWRIVVGYVAFCRRLSSAQNGCRLARLLQQLLLLKLHPENCTLPILFMYHQYPEWA